MARKHLLNHIINPKEASDKPEAGHDGRSAYALRGASRSMLLSLEEMAENSLRVQDGETIVMLDPNDIDPSPYVDRIEEDGEALNVLVEAIREAGQISPILVRPNPDVAGRFILVYGHRRTRAAKMLGIKVRAIIRDLEDLAHIVAQGQENTARADLSFIEKALFASRLQQSGIDRQAIRQALSIDNAMLSRMLSIAEGIPTDILEQIGAAKGIGRDRWDELKRLLLPPAKLEQARQFVAEARFQELGSPERCLALLEELKRKGRRARPKNVSEKKWSLADNKMSVTTKHAANGFSLSLKAADADAFGTYLSAQLEELYDEFQRQQKKG
ncbi:plasmid partitioning protein RepB [Martelella mediterranea]|uniref:plasmid partitioning protein RepB n=1 Tax=Martelella mediterranea TaxID=293089 RepID=UPI001E4B457E|nr:plasmid partitioning protein RepB [Martelella mediterranea]MCD1635752.1 plasmid partitioning protein RepB [Martelella mediterranea]